jgi:translation initiation factor IF-1
MSRGQGQEGASGQGPGASPERGQPAEVVELLPSAAYRLRLESEAVVVAHPAGVAVKNFERLRLGDHVRVELSPRDNRRGRIVELLKKG